MKKLATCIGAAMLLVGCGQNDNMEMGAPAENQSGSSTSSASDASFGGVDTGINGTGASGNGSGGTLTTDTNNPPPIPPSVSAGTGAGWQGEQSVGNAPGEQTNSGDNQTDVQIEGRTGQDFSTPQDESEGKDFRLKEDPNQQEQASGDQQQQQQVSPQ